MADGFEMDLSEVNRLAFDLGRVGVRALPRIRKVVAKSGMDVVAGAQQIVPVDTGATKNSIGIDIDFGGLGFEAGPTTDYAIYLELGTSRMGPRAFMGPSFDRVMPATEEALAEAAAESI